MPLLLVVDDSAQVGLILRKIGQRAGCDVVCQLDAERAWSWLQTGRPTVALIDEHLPGAHGHELIGRLRAHGELGQLPIALLGHWNRPADLVRGLAAGADLICVKDLLARPELCQQRLEEILAWSAGRRAPASLRWQGVPGAERFARAVSSLAVGYLGPELLAEMWRRTVRAASAESGVPAETLMAWFDQDRGALNRAPLAATAPETVHLLTALFAEQLWCMVGTAGSAAFRAALAEEPARR